MWRVSRKVTPASSCHFICSLHFSEIVTCNSERHHWCLSLQTTLFQTCARCRVEVSAAANWRSTDGSGIKLSICNGSSKKYGLNVISVDIKRFKIIDSAKLLPLTLSTDGWRLWFWKGGKSNSAYECILNTERISPFIPLQVNNNRKKGDSRDVAKMCSPAQCITDTVAL